MIREPPLATLARSEVIEPPGLEVVLPANASPLDFLYAVYRDPAQPIARRMRAAIEALPFVHPKLAVTASVDTRFGDRLEAAIKRSGMNRSELIIEAREVG